MKKLFRGEPARFVEVKWLLLSMYVMGTYGFKSNAKKTPQIVLSERQLLILFWVRTSKKLSLVIVLLIKREL